MDATDRIADEYDRLVAIDPEELVRCSFGRQFLFWVVATRCQIDIGGIQTVFEDLLGPDELEILITGLERLDEKDLADEFRHGYQLLKEDGFYAHRNWRIVTPTVDHQIHDIGERIGDRMWELDEKLATLLDGG